MPALRQSLSGFDMIAWKETAPDFRRRPVEELLRALPFMAACAVILDGRGIPRVLAARSVLDSVWSHLAESRVEMGGLLIGKVHSLDETAFVVSIEDFARGDEFDGTGVSLRLETGVWEAARLRLTAEQSVIGWYHSHPNLGVFFSGTDRRTQSAFFNHPHCLGLVVDPVRREEKWFIGGDSEHLPPEQILRYGGAAVARDGRPDGAAVHQATAARGY
jgi:proteasome lid subunit RPN8/RPN11